MPHQPCARWIHLHWLFLDLRWIHLHGLIAILWGVDLHGLDESAGANARHHSPAIGVGAVVSLLPFLGPWRHRQWFPAALLARASDRGLWPGFARSSSRKHAQCQNGELLRELCSSHRAACLCNGRLVTSPTEAAVAGRVAHKAMKAPLRGAILLAREKGCPSGSGTAVKVPLCALGCSPVVVAGLGSPEWASGQSVRGGSGSLRQPRRAGLPASGMVRAGASSRAGQRGGEGLASCGLLRRGDGRSGL